jgi:predicted small lipoprotein YifL
MERMLKLSVLLLAWFSGTGCGKAPEPVGCRSDDNCKHDRVCEDGKCVDPADGPTGGTPASDDAFARFLDALPDAYCTWRVRCELDREMTHSECVDKLRAAAQGMNCARGKRVFDANATRIEACLSSLAACGPDDFCPAGRELDDVCEDGSPASSVPPATAGSPAKSCGSCGTYGSFGQCCGGTQCGGECLGSSCCRPSFP